MSHTLPTLRSGCRQHQQHLGRCRLIVRRPQPASWHSAQQPSTPRSWSIRMLSSSTASSQQQQQRVIKPDIERLRHQPTKVIPDYLTPMPSHLLTTMLADLELCGASSTPHGGASSPSSTLPLRRPGGSAAESAESSPMVQSPPPSLPQGHHLVYFPILAAPSHLAPDGADIDHSPGAHYSRRLWAGGEVTFRDGTGRSAGEKDVPRGALVLDGQPWTCTETIGDVRVKEASTGLAKTQGQEKIFVDVWRRYALGHPTGQESLPWSIEERRTLVFMNPGDDADTPTGETPKIIKYPHEAAHCVQILPSPRHLFHFSALTFNAHAIHLDPEYARSVDGHRAPLVHGPLTLALMLRVLTGYSGQLVSRFVYRNHAPLYVDEPLTVKVRPVPSRADRSDSGATWDAWVEGPDGGLAAKGTATMAA
ncbi:hypothetical protein LEL_03545 [Akanthomyces lecanii RCEF 1005]|uniref:Uncharacterized protein n=1 Tax=Akanthomyces lecanii RCEF 1005 TaxID=1081108 RepID=A0A168J6D1_CORDF|nr:hypothetical protein LEL_03545 [Akanthomyces lecanii RCEF 1005]